MIGIIGAMDAEVEAIFDQMTDKEKLPVNNLVFYKGKLFGKEVVVVKCGVGKVNTALCTQLLIQTFKVDSVINTGIAGATGKGLKIYDFVVSTEAVYHDFDTTLFGYKLGQVPGMPETYKADEKLADLALKAFENSDISSQHKIMKGRIASGDQFISSAEKKDFIVKNFQPACVEMEGCAIAHACYANKVPFVIIRCMSDCADEEAKEAYEEVKASKASSSFLLEVIKEF